MLFGREVKAMKHRLLTLSMLLLAFGCSNELETGYKPTKIGVSNDERRAYYAPAFSPEEQAGKQGDEKDQKARRPYQTP